MVNLDHSIYCCGGFLARALTTCSLPCFINDFVWNLFSLLGCCTFRSTLDVGLMLNSKSLVTIHSVASLQRKAKHPQITLDAFIPDIYPRAQTKMKCFHCIVYSHFAFIPYAIFNRWVLQVKQWIKSLATILYTTVPLWTPFLFNPLLGIFLVRGENV